MHEQGFFKYRLGAKPVYQETLHFNKINDQLPKIQLAFELKHRVNYSPAAIVQSRFA